MIAMHCPHCQEALSIPDQYAGQAGVCKKCGERIQVPAASAGAGADSGLPDDLANMLDESFARERPQPIVVNPSLGDRLQPLAKPLGIGLAVIAVAAVVLGGLTYLPSISLNKAPGPEEVTRLFVEASNAGNLEQSKTYLTAKSREMMPDAGAVPQDFPKPDSYTVGTAQVNGTSAEVPLEVTVAGMTASNDVLLRQEGGEWRVYGMRMTPVPGMTMTMDFENPEAMAGEVQKMMEGMTPEMMQQMMQGAMQ